MSKIWMKGICVVYWRQYTPLLYSLQKCRHGLLACLRFLRANRNRFYSRPNSRKTKKDDKLLRELHVTQLCYVKTTLTAHVQPQNNAAFAAAERSAWAVSVQRTQQNMLREKQRKTLSRSAAQPQQTQDYSAAERERFSGWASCVVFHVRSFSTWKLT